MHYKILVAEDDEDIIQLLKLYLENEGFSVLTAKDGVEAMEILEKEAVDLALLDLMMPRMNGYELTKKIREMSNIPIIILTAKNQDSDKILGLNIGADDYLTKPFNPLEIIARVRSNLRRFYDLNTEKAVKQEENTLVQGELTLDLETFTLYKSGEEVILTPTEYKILQLLMKSPGRIYTKVQLYEKINGEYFENDDNTMMVHISRLREKIEQDSKNPKYIKTVRGLGYKFESK
ncbi:response regulator transcription factor [Niameybacter massiliensis]|uniref:Stage 0 sporulation protein A homolog n=1 Tax=Holtiella tumoricola TaxID=3018743 RepID=A0AA42DS24_9FIRM|nr:MULTISPECIES: response regulator transcription factor [Lachnospirales]MDA3734096.1 response regulator transcription factor [Holtiella tumoricola]